MAVEGIESSADGRKAEILSAAANLFAARGIDATSVREIGERVGLNPGALYHYFPSKSAIARELITGYLTDLLADYEAAGLADLDPRTRLKAIIDVSLATGAAHPDATKVYHSEFANLRTLRDYSTARDLTNRIQQLWLDAIEAGKDTGVLRKDIPSKVFHRFLRDAVWFSVYWRKADDSYPLDELSEHCISLFLDGMAIHTV
ncbi:TetR/AcrR family transcriptional regulator [Nocardia neocaledoniensis]|uniref:TetR/AcrR family transcriptional regulator n=1 Tax=Nocardia neocaledoniensis TaxID=236511 RepID=UPI0024576ED2|nr:TetR/AcrR family transcriptional regulator [Nocardia neocaledoniensis]